MKPEPLIQTTIFIRKDQLHKIKHEAVDIDSNMSAIIRELIDEHFKEQQKGEKIRG